MVASWGFKQGSNSQFIAEFLEGILVGGKIYLRCDVIGYFDVSLSCDWLTFIESRSLVNSWSVFLMTPINF